MDRDVKYLFTPYDGTPGRQYEDFEEKLLNAGAKADDEGWSLSDHFLGVDAGSLNGPLFPTAPAANAKAQTAYRKRQINSYALLTQHVLDAEHVSEMRRSYFQNGNGAFLYLKRA